VSHPCKRYLPRSLMTHYDPVNKLYCGCLAAEIQGLTWIEEQVCAKFADMAVVTRLYQSSGSSQSAVFHGNACAHEMNVDSAVVVLLHTSPDVGGLLSVAFTGPPEPNQSTLEICTVFENQRSGISAMTKSTQYNRLYENVSSDGQVRGAWVMMINRIIDGSWAESPLERVDWYRHLRAR